MCENPGKTIRNPKKCEKGENNWFPKTFGADFGKGERRSWLFCCADRRGGTVPLPLQECSVGPLVAPGVRSPLAERAEDLQGAPQLAGVALWRLLVARRR